MAVMKDTDPRRWLDNALELLDRCLSEWEGEEDSVQQEHAHLIRDLTEFFADYARTFWTPKS